MKVQLITNKKCDFADVTVSTLSAPRSLDEFEINVIDLSDSKLWRCFTDSSVQIDAQNDLKSIQIMVERRTISKIVYALPQNTTFYYNGYKDRGQIQYFKNFFLKDRIN